MNVWTKERLDQMIVDAVEESLSLDYKGADALEKSDIKRTGITKDVSAMANSSGGVLIYGISEFQESAKRHLPERLDVIRRGEFSKEWLEQVIQTIRPQVGGLRIYPVEVDARLDTVCYVVDVPQSDTAHQARDYRYYKRHNFNSIPMEDYEIRDIMNRRKHPKIHGSIFINKKAAREEHDGLILVNLENVGTVLAHHVMVELEIPLNINGPLSVEKPVILEKRDDGFCYVLRLGLGRNHLPIFPGSYVILRRPFSNVREVRHVSGKPMVSAKRVRVKIFADEMPPIGACLETKDVLSGWTSVPSEFPHLAMNAQR